MPPFYKDKKAEKQAINASKSHSISSYLSVSNTFETQPKELKGKMPYPIMKGINSYPVIVDFKIPTKEQLIEAQKEVGVKNASSELKHPNRMTQAEHKFNVKERLMDKRDKYKKSFKKEDDAGKHIEILDGLDLDTLMFDKSGKSADENLADNYDMLKTYFAYLDEYETEINSKIHVNNDLDDGSILSLDDDDGANESAARLKTLRDIKAFYEIHEALMLNEYYTLVPREMMQSLSYMELRTRLNSLYEKKDRDYKTEQLIDYYQNLIRLKELGLTDGKSVKDRYNNYLKPEIEKTEVVKDPAKELKKIAQGFVALNNTVINEDVHLSMEEQDTKYFNDFFRLHGADIEKYRGAAESDEINRLLGRYDQYRSRLIKKDEEDDEDLFDSEGKEDEKKKTASDIIKGEISEDAVLLENRKEEAEGINITGAQKEGIRQICAFLTRRSCRTGKTQEAFVKGVIDMPPEQQLVVFYLVESGRHKVNMGSDFYSAINGYVPDAAAFRKKVCNKYFSSAVNWSIISSAVTSARDMGQDIAKYADLESHITESDLAYENVSNDPEQYEIQEKSLIDLILYRYSMLQLLYRTSGLKPEMPFDLVHDEKLRVRMYEEYKLIEDLSKKLVEIHKAHPIKDQKMPENEGKSDVYKEDQGTSASDAALEVVNTGRQITGYMQRSKKPVETIVGAFASATKDFVKSNSTYQYGWTSLNLLSGVVGICFDIAAIRKYELSKEHMVTVEKWDQRINNTSSVVRNVRNLVTGSTDIMVNSGFISQTGSFAKGVTTASGIVDIVTGTTDIISAGIRLGRNVTSINDMSRSTDRLMSRALNKSTTKDDRKLTRFIHYNTRNQSRVNYAAGVQGIKGALSMLSGILVITGALTIPGIVLGAISFVGGEIYQGVVDAKMRKGVIKTAVDDYLGVNKAVDKIMKDKYDDLEPKEEAKTRDKITKAVRKEALAKLGLSSYKQCFRQICEEFGTLLYDKVFGDKAADKEEKEMYTDALKSMGMKITFPKGTNDKPYPGVNVIVNKLMAG